MSRLLLTALFVSACNGSIADPANLQPGTDPGPWGPGDPPPTLDECLEREASVGVSPLRRLTRAQLRNALIDVLELESLPAETEAQIVELPDGREGGFDSTAGAPSSEALRGYIAIAETLAPQVVASASCTIEETGCAHELLSNLGRRLYRRSLEPQELNELIGIYDAFVDTDGPNVAAQTAVTALIASPNFVYHAEPVLEDRAEGTTLMLDPHAIANRLSFFLWNSVPDETLLQAAESGALDTEEGIAAEVERMLADEKTKRQVRSFYGQWLHLDGVAELTRDNPAWTPELRDKLVEEAYDFVNHVMREGDHTLAELLTASYTIGDDTIAEHYGAASPDGDGRIELNPAERSGLLTHAGVLAELGTVFPEIHRGAWVRGNFLCDPPPAPPADVELDPEVRRLETQPCAGCHIRMDPIGYGLAAFDDMGRFDAALAASAPQPEVISPDDTLDPSVVGTFETPRELGERLAGSPDVEDCVSVQWFRYALGRWESEGDACAVVAMQDEFTRSGGDLHALAGALARSVAFRTRSAAALEEGGAE